MPKTFVKRREKELVEDIKVLESYIETFWDTLPIPVCSTNPIFTILETGNTFDALFGYGKDELMGNSLDILFVKKGDFKQLSQKLSEEKAISDFETTLKTKKGKDIAATISAATREDEEDKIVGYLFSFVDLSLTKKAEKELQKKIEDLKRFERLAIGRELKMIELKKKIREA